MADTYIPGMQFQDWSKVSSLTGDALGTVLAAAIGGPVLAAMRGLKDNKSSESGPSGLPGVIPPQNQENWQNIPSPQIGIPPNPSLGLNPNMTGQSPYGMKPIVGIPPQTPIQQNPLQVSNDLTKIKQTLWE